MEFDIVSMKLRAKDLLRTTNPRPWIAGVFYGVLAFLYVVIF
jgi:hypothetical protein